jgi:hypothetical protein
MSSTNEEIEDLIRLIRDDATGDLPPLASGGVARAQELGSRAAFALLEEIRRGGPSQFLALEALRVADPAAYESLPAQDRAAIYARTLAGSGVFNVWGLPTAPSDTARALTTLGDAAARALAPLLHDERAARLIGSKPSTISQLEHYRVRDYAWAFICLATGRICPWNRDPRIRDEHIKKVIGE